MVRVEPSRLVAARRRSGMTRVALARLLDVSSALIGQWEEGGRDASVRASEIATHLGVPPSFLSRHEMTVTDPATVSFRRRADAKRATRDRAAAAIDLAYADILPMYREVLGALLPPNLPDLRGMDPTSAARTLREMWGLGEAPIKNVVSLLEAKGVRVFTTADDSPSLSAFTRWIEGEPLLFLNRSISDGCRHRFNCAHELAHLVLHRDLDFESEDSRKVEREADTFASAFLMTRLFLNEAPVSFRPEEFWNLKPRWGASANAMVRRLYDANRFTEWQYENAVIWLSKNGYRSNPEPQAGSMEKSVIADKFVTVLADDDLDPARFAREKSYPKEILFEFAPATEDAARAVSLRGLFADEDEPIFESSPNVVFYED